MREVMYDHSKEYEKKVSGQAFELAFSCEDPSDVDESFKQLIEMGATSINEPQDMPWDQRRAFKLRTPQFM